MFDEKKLHQKSCKILLAGNYSEKVYYFCLEKITTFSKPHCSNYTENRFHGYPEKCQDEQDEN